jgi:hypothetical protein
MLELYPTKVPDRLKRESEGKRGMKDNSKVWGLNNERLETEITMEINKFL